MAFGMYIKSLAAVNWVIYWLAKMCPMGFWSYTAALLNPETSTQTLPLVIGLQAAPGDNFH